MIVTLIEKNANIILRVFEVGENMTSNIYIYKCFFQKEQNINLDMRLKYTLSLLYSMSGEDNYFPLKQIELAKIMNITKQMLNNWLLILAKQSYIDIEYGGIIKVNRPNDTDAIPIPEEFLNKKYHSLSYGAKIFYSYYRWLQEEENKPYLIVKGTEIVKPMGRSLRTVQTYYKELEDFGLLEKGKEGSFNTFNFKQI